MCFSALCVLWLEEEMEVPQRTRRLSLESFSMSAAHDYPKKICALDRAVNILVWILENMFIASILSFLLFYLLGALWVLYPKP